MEAEIERRFREYEHKPLAWDPIKGGKKAFICFNDSLTAGIGEDLTGQRFEIIANRMLSGTYYPMDAVEFFGRFQDEGRNIRPGDRVLQRARLLPFLKKIFVWSMVEIYVAERREDFCQIGYVTTTQHHGRGIWTATLTKEDGELELTIESIASPNSWLFWIGLPFARFLQLRARRRGIEEMASQIPA